MSGHTGNFRRARCCKTRQCNGQKCGFFLKFWDAYRDAGNLGLATRWNVPQAETLTTLVEHVRTEAPWVMPPPPPHPRPPPTPTPVVTASLPHSLLRPPLTIIIIITAPLLKDSRFESPPPRLGSKRDLTFVLCNETVSVRVSH